ncbi:SEC12-like protein 2 [Argentina anserina]|uniref:SEC12-like protein 2 n=1 Tax=Argentina anserina TaxID=57926 RepID=UPI0021766787|nr:SEC12-like protein 2 [Potentilla anserina]
MEAVNHIKYGIPFYAVGWAPDAVPLSSQPENDNDNQTSQKTDTESTPSVPDSSHIVLAGGGGEGNSGVKNAVVLVRFDPASTSISHEPVAKLSLGSELPYRMAVHPGVDGLVCAFPESCSWLVWEKEVKEGAHKLSVKQSDRVLEQLQNVGQQLALTFNKDGSVLATGGEDGKVRVFKWPSMETMFTEDQAHKTVKQLDFSHDGKFLVSLGQSGPGRVWDVSSAAVVATLPIEKNEIFCACKFSLSNNGNQVLHLADKDGIIATWNTTTWKRVQSKRITRDGIMSFDVSADGKLLACGTTSGDLLILKSAGLQIHKVVPKAHTGFVTALSFSRDSRVLASTSMDSSARVSTVEEVNKKGVNLWVVILIILVSILAYFYNDPESWTMLKSELEKVYSLWQKKGL